MLKTAEPITSLIPISFLVKNTAIITVANSGAELPAAIKVAPTISSLSLKSEMYNAIVIFSGKQCSSVRVAKKHNGLVLITICNCGIGDLFILKQL